MLFFYCEVHDGNYIAPFFGFNDDKTCFIASSIQNTTAKISITKPKLKTYREQFKTLPDIWFSI